MTAEAIVKRLTALLERAKEHETSDLQAELLSGTITVMTSLYGKDSAQESALRAFIVKVESQGAPGNPRVMSTTIAAIRGALQAIQGDIDAGVLTSLRASVTGEVLADFVKLARLALEPDQGADNVAAVLTAAAFEDALRRMAALRGLPDRDRLQDTVTDLKDAGVLKGPQVGVAQSYLSFRNKALHAKWAEVDRMTTGSCLAFVEQLILADLS